jgi:hypothetical protein
LLSVINIKIQISQQAQIDGNLLHVKNYFTIIFNNQYVGLLLTHKMK